MRCLDVVMHAFNSQHVTALTYMCVVCSRKISSKIISLPYEYYMYVYTCDVVDLLAGFLSLLIIFSRKQIQFQ